MKRRFAILAAVISGLILALTCQPSRAAVKSSGELAALHEAYAALHAADHDYKGHRHKAMEAIEQAVKELGGSVKGDGRAHEPQGESDAQLKKAQQLLEGFSNSATGKKSRVARHVQHALKELSIALSIK